MFFLRYAVYEGVFRLCGNPLGTILYKGYGNYSGYSCFAVAKIIIFCIEECGVCMLRRVSGV